MDQILGDLDFVFVYLVYILISFDEEQCKCLTVYTRPV